MERVWGVLFSFFRVQGTWAPSLLKESGNRTSFLWQTLVNTVLEIGPLLNQGLSNFSVHRQNDLKGV